MPATEPQMTQISPERTTEPTELTETRSHFGDRHRATTHQPHTRSQPTLAGPSLRRATVRGARGGAPLLFLGVARANVAWEMGGGLAAGGAAAWVWFGMRRSTRAPRRRPPHPYIDEFSTPREQALNPRRVTWFWFGLATALTLLG